MISKNKNVSLFVVSFLSDSHLCCICMVMPAIRITNPCLSGSARTHLTHHKLESVVVVIIINIIIVTITIMMQAVDLLTDINKLAAQARRFLKPDSKPTRASSSAPRSPASSSHPGTPPPDYGGAGGSVTSPLLSPRRSLESQPSQLRGLSRNNSTGLGSRNLAGPFGAAAVQGKKNKKEEAIVYYPHQAKTAS